MGFNSTGKNMRTFIGNVPIAPFALQLVKLHWQKHSANGKLSICSFFASHSCFASSFITTYRVDTDFRSRLVFHWWSSWNIQIQFISILHNYDENVDRMRDREREWRWLTGQPNFHWKLSSSLCEEGPQWKCKRETEKINKSVHNNPFAEN